MTPDPAPAPRRWRHLSLRLRLTLLTTLIVALALGVGGLVLASSVSKARLSGLAAIGADRTNAIAELAVTDQIPEALSTTYPGEIAQIVDADGQVIVTSTNGSRTLPAIPSAMQRDMAGAQTRSQAEDGARTTANTPYSPQPVTVVTQESQWRGATVTVIVAVPAQEVFSTVESLHRSLLIVVPILIVVWAIMAWLLLGRALRPVEDLRLGAEAVTSTGAAGALPVPQTHDEIAALARTLNTMLDRLRSASKRQAEFVGDAAHELRSPLAAMRLTSEVAQTHPETTTTEQLAAEFLPEISRMQTLVDDLLVLARLGSVRRIPEPVELSRIAERASAQSMPSSSAALTTQLIPRIVGTGAATTDPAAATRIVRNLVDNARRYATDILIEIAPGTITVADNGPGISAPDRERIFERFVRLDDARTRDSGGSGLGLAIARELAQDLGGTVIVTDSQLGGVAFKVTLPR